MHPTLHRITNVNELDAEWTRLGPLFEQFSRHHVLLSGGQPRAHQQDRTLKHLRTGFGDSRSLLVAVENEDALVAMGMGQVGPSGSMPGAQCGHMAGFFVEPRWRGSPLVKRLHENIEAWLRSRGLTWAERSVFAKNERTLALWRHFGFRPYSVIAKRTLAPLGPTSSEPTRRLGVRRIENVGEEWPLLAPLIAMQVRQGPRFLHPNGDSEYTQRERLMKLSGAAKCRILLAEEDGRPVGFATARLSKNPWFIEERVGVIDDFGVDSATEPPHVADELLREIYKWLMRKGASAAQKTLAVGQLPLWQQRDCEPRFFALRKSLV